MGETLGVLLLWGSGGWDVVIPPGCLGCGVTWDSLRSGGVRYTRVGNGYQGYSLSYPLCNPSYLRTESVGKYSRGCYTW